MRYLAPVVAVMLLAAGCPATDAPSEADGTRPVAGAVAPEPAAGAYPPPVIDFLLASLREPVTGNRAPLGSTWMVLARLPGLAEADSLAEVRQAVRDHVAKVADNPPPELCSAWLQVDGDEATAFLRQGLAAGEDSMLGALWYAPETGRALVNELALSDISEQTASTIIDLVLYWGPTTADKALLSGLVEQPADHVAFRAAGVLLRLDSANEAAFYKLSMAVRDGTGGSALAEGIKLSGDERFAGALVSRVAQVTMGELDPEAEKDFTAILAAYALAYLPGNQASLMRGKLLSAADPTIRWQARLGELLQGKPGYWQTAVTAETITDRDLWTALQPADVVSPDLVPTYELAARQEDAQYRALAALHLNRYSGFASDQRVQNMIHNLIEDTEPEIRAAAWYAAGELRLPDLMERAVAVVSDDSQSGDVRIAAAHAALQLAGQQAAAGVSK